MSHISPRRDASAAQWRRVAFQIVGLVTPIALPAFLIGRQRSKLEHDAGSITTSGKDVSTFGFDPVLDELVVVLECRTHAIAVALPHSRAPDYVGEEERERCVL